METWSHGRSRIVLEIAAGQEAETQSSPDRFFLCGIIGVSQTVQQGFIPPTPVGDFMLYPFLLF